MKISVKSRPGLNSFQLKIIALIFMTMDHLGAYQTLTASQSANDFLRVLGRIAAPLFLFIVVESLRHTRNKAKFILRLYVAGVVIEILNRILEEATQSFSIGNILPTFFYVALFVMAIEGIIERRDKRSVLISGICFVIPLLTFLLNIVLSENGYLEIWNYVSLFLPSVFKVEYSLIFVLLGVAWYFINNKRISCILFAVLSLLCLVIPSQLFFMIPLRCFSPVFFNAFELFVDTQWCMCLAIPFILLYDGTRGKSMKYFFYIYYPVHVHILHLIAYS